MAVGLGILGIVAASVQLDPRRMAAGPYRQGVTRLPEEFKLLAHVDGKTATVSVIEAGGACTLATNGKTDASVALPGYLPTEDDPAQVLSGAPGLGANPQAKRVAVVGIGSGITSATLLGAPTLQRVDTIEIERRMIDGAKLFADRNATVWSDDRRDRPRAHRSRRAPARCVAGRGDAEVVEHRAAPDRRRAHDCPAPGALIIARWRCPREPVSGRESSPAASCRPAAPCGRR